MHYEIGNLNFGNVIIILIILHLERIFWSDVNHPRISLFKFIMIVKLQPTKLILKPEVRIPNCK